MSSLDYIGQILHSAKLFTDQLHVIEQNKDSKGKLFEMKFKITAVNTKNPSEKFEYELEGESVDSFKYFDEAEGKFFHPKEVLNNKMREINNNLMLNDSPIFTIKKAGEKANIKAMTFDIEIESI